MKKLLTIAMLAALAAALPAQADAATLVEGDILVGNPNGKVLGGISEIAGTGGLTCGASDLDGVDGLVFAVPEDARGREATLTTTGATAVDVDVYWYTDGCASLITDEDDPNAYDLAVDLEASGTGMIPAAAAIGVADLTVGAAAHVLVTYEH